MKNTTVYVAPRQYFGKKAIEAADNNWDEQGWNDEKIEELLNTKLRKRD